MYHCVTTSMFCTTTGTSATTGIINGGSVCAFVFTSLYESGNQVK